MYTAAVGGSSSGSSNICETGLLLSLLSGPHPKVVNVYEYDAKVNTCEYRIGPTRVQDGRMRGPIVVNRGRQLRFGERVGNDGLFLTTHDDTYLQLLSVITI